MFKLLMWFVLSIVACYLFSVTKAKMYVVLARQLHDQYDKWVNDKPVNLSYYKFQELLEYTTGKQDITFEFADGNYTKETSLVLSFPSTQHYVASQQLTHIHNFVILTTEKYESMFSLYGFLKFLYDIPSNIWNMFVQLKFKQIVTFIVWCLAPIAYHLRDVIYCLLMDFLKIR